MFYCLVRSQAKTPFGGFLSSLTSWLFGVLALMFVVLVTVVSEG